MIPTDNRRKYKSSATISSSIPKSSPLYWDIIALRLETESAKSHSISAKTDKDNKNTPSKKRRV